MAVREGKSMSEQARDDREWTLLSGLPARTTPTLLEGPQLGEPHERLTVVPKSALIHAETERDEARRMHATSLETRELHAAKLVRLEDQLITALGGEPDLLSLTAFAVDRGRMAQIESGEAEAYDADPKKVLREWTERSA